MNCIEGADPADQISPFNLNVILYRETFQFIIILKRK